MTSRAVNDFLEFQRDRLILWLPVGFGAGIGIYFALDVEPTFAQMLALGVVSIISAAAIRRENLTRTLLCSLTLCLAIGVSYSALKTELGRAPVMKRHYYGPVYGRVIGIDRSASNSVRVMLDRLYLPGIAPKDTPERVRISLQGLIPADTLNAGARIATTASISPPGSPVEPGGFDFRRMAWFMKLGGVGYTRNPVLPDILPENPDFMVQLLDLRLRISRIITAEIPGQNGSFASAIITGDRSNIDPKILENLRASNLAHLLAISGLHMGLLTGFVFALSRIFLSIIPGITLRRPVKKIAALIAIAFGLFYLLLSGASVATQRAFIMSTVVFVAILLDKPAFTLRAVAVAAMIVLIIQPYSVLEAGFQMSFAATTALIATYESLNRQLWWKSFSKRAPKLVMGLVALVITSAVAGAATAPISAFHFNQLSNVGLIANLLAVPIMGLIVMPSAVLALLLSLIGFGFPAFWVMGKGIGAILYVSGFVANLENSVTLVKSAPSFVLAILAVGGLFVLLWSGRARLLGLVPIILALHFWQSSTRPAFFISESGTMIGLLTDEGRVVNKPKGSGYEVRIWLENDGDGATQETAFMRQGFQTQKDKYAAVTKFDWVIVLYNGKNTDVPAKLCQDNMILVLPKLVYKSSKCIAIDKPYLSNSGAIAVRFTNGLPDISHSREGARNRPWGS